MKKFNKLNLIVVTATIMITSLSSCKKYEEGPAFSLRSKTARVANEWKITYAYDMDDAEDVTSDYTGETWEFVKDGKFNEKDNGTVEKTGTWEFIDDKESIRVSLEGTGSSTNDYTIIKLKEKEMWLKDKDEELHFIPK